MNSSIIFDDPDRSMHNERNLTTIAKKLRSSLHGEFQLKLFIGEAVPDSILLDKHSIC